MAEVHWLPGIITLALGIGLGIFALVLLRHKDAGSPRPTWTPTGSSTPSSQMRIDDMRQEKLRLMRALRDLQDRASDSENSDNERRQLQLRAAEIFKALHEAETSVEHSDTSAPAAGAPTDAPVATGAGPDAGAFGAFKWMAVGAFFPLVAISLYFGIAERTDDMTPMTGGNPALSQPVLAGPMPQPGKAGGPVPGVPPDLVPKPSAAVDRARAQVAAHPDEAEAWAALGWALVEAEGWIDVYETARRIQQLDVNNPDGLVLEASVLLAMGQGSKAQRLVTDALTLDSSHIQGLSFQGAMSMQRGDSTGAKVAWTQALRVAGPGNGFEELIAMAESGNTGMAALPEGHPQTDRPATRMPPGQPGAAQSPAPAGGGPKFEGRLLLAEGAVPPSGSVIFIIARHKGARGGPPAAAKRLPVGSFPIAFSISSADAMMGGTLPEEITLTARIDADGNAGTRGPEDLVAASVDARSGGSAVELVLKPSP